MRTWLAMGVVAGIAFGSGPGGYAATYGDAPPGMAGPTMGGMITGCITAAASLYRLPPAVLVILLRVEGGTLGHVSRNNNNSVDIGPMQVNQIWLPKIAQHWHATIPESFAALRDSFCANVEGGSWILRQAIDEAHGDFWTGVAIYHSHESAYQAAYLRQVLSQVMVLEQIARDNASRVGPAG